MTIAITGHTSGLGQAIYAKWAGSCVGFSRSNGYDIDDPTSRTKIVQEASQCEVFVNCAHSGMSQVYLLYELAQAWRRTDKLIINISSNSADGIKSFPHVYAVEKAALDKASEQLAALRDSCRIVNLRPGWIDVARVRDITEDAKIPIDTMVDTIGNLITQPVTANIRSMTIIPRARNAEWYYSDLTFPYFTSQRCDAMRDIALRVIDEARHSGYEYSNFDHLRFYDITQDMPELKDLMDDCAVSARADIFFLPPNVVMPVHSDTKDYDDMRASSIAVSLLPDINIPATNWYWSKSQPPCVTACWDRYDAKLLNIQSLHGGIKTDDRWRANLQISLAAGYDRVLELIRANRLFANHDVRLKHG